LRTRNPKLKEAQKVFELQESILDDLAMDLQSVKAQLQMFPEGTYLAEQKMEDDEWVPVGLISSVRWESSFTPDFGKLHGTYSHTHISTGSRLFVHTIAVASEHRQKGIATRLIGEELNLAALLTLDSVMVVSSKQNLSLVENLGFTIVQHLPEFLPYHQEKFQQPMLMEITLR
jgi:ribosomal protein S18 acetylase RimI-like enzyme